MSDHSAALRAQLVQARTALVWHDLPDLAEAVREAIAALAPPAVSPAKHTDNCNLKVAECSCGANVEAMRQMLAAQRVDYAYACGCYWFCGNIVACPKHSPERVSARVKAEADRAAAAPAPEACGCGWEGGLRRYCDQHNPCFPASLRNEARAAAPAPEPIVSPNEPHCGNCGGTQFETVPVVDGGEEERCLTCGESERVSSPADRAPAALAPEGLDALVNRLTDQQRQDVSTLLRAWLPGLTGARRPTWDEWDAAAERLYGSIR